MSEPSNKTLERLCFGKVLRALNVKYITCFLTISFSSPTQILTIPTYSVTQLYFILLHYYSIVLLVMIEAVESLSQDIYPTLLDKQKQRARYNFSKAGHFSSLHRGGGKRVHRVHLHLSIFTNRCIAPVLIDNCPLKGSC